MLIASKKSRYDTNKKRKMVAQAYQNKENERKRKRETKKFPRLRFLEQEMPNVFRDKYNLSDRERKNTHEVDLFDFFCEKRTNSLF